MAVRCVNREAHKTWPADDHHETLAEAQACWDLPGGLPSVEEAARALAGSKNTSVPE